MFMDYVPDVAGFKKLAFKNAPSYICESKLRRTKPFYIAQFEALKALTKPEVCLIPLTTKISAHRSARL
jgi:hypothetical protein